MDQFSESLDIEIRIFKRTNEGYPAEITLGNQLSFPRGYLSSDILSWIGTINPVDDGRRLWKWLFKDPNLLQAWATAQGNSQNHRIRLRIDDDAAELHILPWELLQKNGSDMLSAQANTPFSRYSAVKSPWEGAVTKRPIRVLVVISNPEDLEAYDLTPVDVNSEHEELKNILKGVPDLQFEFLDGLATLVNIENALRNVHYDVLHYVGHGAFNPHIQKAVLYFQDENGLADCVYDKDFAGMLARQGVRPRLVFLTACQSAVFSLKDASLGLGQELVRAGVPVVIAMQGEITTVTARAFSKKFYQQLMIHGQVDLAVNQARSSLLTAHYADAWMPVLFTCLKSGRLWENESKQVQIILHGDYEKFDETRRNALITTLAVLLDINPSEVFVLKVRAGSIILDLLLPKKAADSLYNLARAQNSKIIDLKPKSVLVEGKGIVKFPFLIPCINQYKRALVVALLTLVIMFTISFFPAISTHFFSSNTPSLSPTTFISSTLTSSRTITFTQTSTSTLTSTSTFTPTLTPTSTFTFTPTPVCKQLPASDWSCWTVREDIVSKKRYGSQVFVIAQNRLEFDVDFSQAAEYRGQIHYTLGAGGVDGRCKIARPPFVAASPDSQFSVVIQMLSDIPNLQAEIFLQGKDYRWFAGRDLEGSSTDLFPNSFTTVRAVRWVTGNPPIPIRWDKGQEFISLGIEFKVKEKATIPSGLVKFVVMPVEICTP